MKKIITSLFITTLSMSAIAGNCLSPNGPGEFALEPNASFVLSNKTLCGSSPSNSDTWQEFHQSGGALIEYALGPGHPTDPTHTVGSWAASGNQITYTYTDGGSYTFELWQKYNGSGTLLERAICSSTDNTRVANIDDLKNNQVSCN